MMRIKHYDDAETFEPIARPKVARFKQTTVKKRTTRADLVCQAESVRGEFPDRSSTAAIAYDRWRSNR